MMNMDPDKLKQLSDQLGLSGPDLLTFVSVENKAAREDRARERSLERFRLENNSATPAPQANHNLTKLKLLPYNEGEDLSSYLTRFERIANVYKWDDAQKAIQLASLLKDKTLEIYSTYDDEISNSYDNLKEALLNSYRLNDDHYRKEFRTSRIKIDYTFKQFGIDLSRKFDYWLGSAKVAKTFDSLRDFMITDQFLSAVPPEVRTFIKEQDPSQNSVTDVSALADTYGNAHPNVYKISNVSNKPIPRSKPKFEEKNVPSADKNVQSRYDFSKVKCYSCGELGHKKPYCPKNPKSNVQIHKVAHDSIKTSNTIPRPMYQGTVNGARVSTILNDTGCSCVMVHDDIVPDCDVTDCKMICSDYLGRKDSFPLVDIYLKCELFEGWVKAVRAPLQHCAVLLGNVNWYNGSSADLRVHTAPAEPRALCDATPINAVTTRSSAKRNVIHPLILPDIEPLKLNKLEFSQLQNNCDSLTNIRSKVITGERVTSRSKREYEFVMLDDLIFRKCVNSPNQIEINKYVLVVPAACRKLVLKTSHDLPVSGHFSHRRTEMKICDKFWWPGLSSDVRRYCKSCDSCQRMSARGRTRRVAMVTMPIISTPFERVAIDIVGPLSPPTRGGHRYILTMIDYATSFIEAVPLKEITSVVIAEALMELFARVGIPREVISDRGSNFTSDLMGQVHKLVGIKPIFTTPYHPQTNGKLERQHAVMKSILRKLCQDKPNDWNRYLIPTLFAMREVPSETTGYSPFELLYGRQVRGPLAILNDLWIEPELDQELRTSYEYVIELRERIEDTAQLAMENSKIKTQMYKNYFDKNSVKRTFKQGDEILLLLPDSTNKLLTSWKGPYSIIAVKSNLNYVIDVGGNHKLFHVNLLKPYVRRATTNCMFLMDETPTLDYLGINSNQLVNTCVIPSNTEDDVGHLYLLDKENNQCMLNICPELSGSRRESIKAALLPYQHVLSDLPGLTNTLTHTITLNTTGVVCNRNYPIPVHLREAFNDEIDRMLDMGVITPSCSNFCSPSVVVEKQGSDPKSYRITQDFRALNAITKFDAEPMPSIEGDLRKFSQAKFISEIDITRAYYQIPLDVDSRKYTAFATSYGLMEYVKMPFGLVTACATYVRLMRKVFANLPAEASDCISIYFDNIFIATESFEHHLELLKFVFERLSNHGLTARPSKCNFLYSEINYLGFRVGKGMLSPLPSNLVAITEMPKPANKKQLRSFLGMLSFYRIFIPNLANLTAPLSDMLKKGTKEPLAWNSLSSENFDILKNVMVTPPILKIPDLSRQFCLRTDASNHGLGAMLFQYFENIPQPVSYASRKLLAAERNYASIEKECLALVWAVDKFRYYLYGKEFIIETDHRPLTYLQNFRDKNPRLTRWALSLQPYKFTVVYIPGKDNHGADILSRCI